MPVEREIEKSPDLRDLPSRPPTPRVLVPEADSAGGSSKQRQRSRLLLTYAVLAAAIGAMWIGVTLGRGKTGADAQPAAVSPDKVVPLAPTPAPARSDSVSAPNGSPRDPLPKLVPKSVSVPKPAPRRAPPRSRPAIARPSPVNAKPEPPEPPPAEASARLIIRSVPGGTLYIDDRLIGPAVEMAVPVPPGRHIVRITKPGYRPYSKQVDVVAGEERRLTDVVVEPEH